MQDIELDFSSALVDHLAEVGYDPEFGARALKRRIRSEVEAWLADAMLRDEVKPGERLRLTYDPDSGQWPSSRRSRIRCRFQLERRVVA